MQVFQERISEEITRNSVNILTVLYKCSLFYTRLACEEVTLTVCLPLSLEGRLFRTL